jgi:hypothetical protein
MPDLAASLIRHASFDASARGPCPKEKTRVPPKDGVLSFGRLFCPIDPSYLGILSPRSSSIFETLNWAVAIDFRLGKTLGTRERWPASYAAAGFVLGFRYARNTVHHDWADALYVDYTGLIVPSPLPAPLFEWRWLRELPATRDKGQAEYARHLAGEPVRFTLEALESLFLTAVDDSYPRDPQLRYFVRFSDGGSGIRLCDEPLKLGDELVDSGALYRVARVEESPNLTSFGYVWAELAAG